MTLFKVDAQLSTTVVPFSRFRHPGMYPKTQIVYRANAVKGKKSKNSQKYLI